VRELADRHIAWLTCLRYELRSPRRWETVEAAPNAEFRKAYRIPEREVPIEDALREHLSDDELQQVLAASSKPTQVLWLQSRALKRLHDDGSISFTCYIELGKLLKDFIDQQGRAERIKNYPYPRQYAIINRIFVWAFCASLPFGLLKEFDRLNEGISGLMQGNMVWLVVPFSATVCWMYTSLEQVGQSTENPFEGSANDVPITQIATVIASELREMAGEPHVPASLATTSDIVL
jgi:putative membrane protein